MNKSNLPRVFDKLIFQVSIVAGHLGLTQKKCLKLVIVKQTQ